VHPTDAPVCAVRRDDRLDGPRLVALALVAPVHAGFVPVWAVHGARGAARHAGSLRRLTRAASAHVAAEIVLEKSVGAVLATVAHSRAVGLRREVRGGVPGDRARGFVSWEMRRGVSGASPRRDVCGKMRG